MKDIFAKYTIDIMFAMYIFGIKIDSLKDPTNQFYVYGTDAANFSGILAIKAMVLKTFTNLGRILNLKIIDSYVSDFFRNTIIVIRDAEYITHSSMIQLLMGVRGKEDRSELDIDDMIAQVFTLFFVYLFFRWLRKHFNYDIFHCLRNCS